MVLLTDSIAAFSQRPGGFELGYGIDPTCAVRVRSTAFEWVIHKVASQYEILRVLVSQGSDCEQFVVVVVLVELPLTR